MKTRAALALRLAEFRERHSHPIGIEPAADGGALLRHDPMDPVIRAEPGDLSVLVEAGLVTEQQMDYGPALIVQPRILAARESLLASGRERLLHEVVYALVRGRAGETARIEDILRAVHIDPNHVDALLNRLLTKGRLGVTAGGVYLTGEGILSIIEDPHPAAGPASPTYNIAAVANFQAVPGAIAYVNQSVGFSAEDILRIIRETREAVSELEPADQNGANEALDDLAEEVSKPQPKPSKVRAFRDAAVKWCGKGTESALRMGKLYELLERWLGSGPA